MPAPFSCEKLPSTVPPVMVTVPPPAPSFDTYSPPPEPEAVLLSTVTLVNVTGLLAVDWFPT